MKSLRLLLMAAGIFVCSVGDANAQSTITLSGTKYTLCAQEYGTCSFKGSGSVVFGAAPPNAPTAMLSKPATFKNGVACYVGQVSNTDPAYGYGKSCWVAVATTPPVTTPPVVTPPTKPPVTTPPVTPPVTTPPVITPPVVTPPVTTPPVTTPPVTTPPSTPTSGSNSLTCASPTQTAGGNPNGLISVDVSTTDNLRVFANNAPFKMNFVTAASGSDNVVWSVADAWGNIKAQGSFAVKSGTQTSSLSCVSTWSGYAAVTATLQAQGGTLPYRGSQPQGVMSFGVLPNLKSSIGTVNYSTPDQHRFGMQGFNGNINALHDLGISWTIDDRQQSVMEPNAPNTYVPLVSDLDSFYKTNPDQLRIVRLDGIPPWNSKTGQFNDSYQAPRDLNEYQQFMSKVGVDTNLIHALVYPTARYNYYQVTWEPSLGFSDTDANFVALYKAAYQGIHSTDPNAIVMGTANPFAANCDTCTSGYLKRFGALGLFNYIDAVSTHNYWNAGTFAAHPPELQDSDPDPANQANSLPNQMIQLRSVMQQGKPNMKLFATEGGASYDPGITYSSNQPSQNQLFGQAAVAVRAHIITIGEGAQVTTFFFGPDYPNEIGYGTFFDLDHQGGAFGASNLAPKPVAMAYATMTRALDGTNTLGRVKNTPAGVYAYGFQQLNGGKIVTAAWTHSNAQWPKNGVYSTTYSVSYNLQVDSPGTSGTVTKVDGYGNTTSVKYTNGAVTLTLTEMPQYIVSNNASVSAANSTVPVGYTGQ